MTFEAQYAPAGSGYKLRTPEERARAFRAAIRHTRWVSILRMALPILALVVFAAYFISSRMSVTVGGVTAGFSGVEVKDGVLRMVKPTLKGVDKKQGAYVVNADYADQDMKNPKLVRLHVIKAELANQKQGWSKLEAIRGMFDSGTERLVMQDDIRVSTSSGLVGKLTYASLDMANQIMRSHMPVAFDMPTGTVRANAMTLNSQSKTLTFRGKVKVHIKKVGNKQPGKDGAGASAASPQAKAPGLPTAISPMPAPALPGAAPSQSASPAEARAP